MRESEAGACSGGLELSAPGQLQLEANPATTMSIAELSEVFNASFEGYIVPLRLLEAAPSMS
jgi:hypothetical protein